MSSIWSKAIRLYLCGWWSLYSHRDQVFTSQQYQTQASLLLSVTSFCTLWLHFSEFIAIAQNQVHVLIKGFESTHKGSSILKCAAHPVVDMLQHLRALSDNLKHRYTDKHRGQKIFKYCACPAGRVTLQFLLISHPPNTCTCPFEVYADKNIRM